MKTALRFYLSPVRMTLINNTKLINYSKGGRQKENLLHCWQKCKLVHSIQKSVLSFLKSKLELSYDLIIIFIIFPKEFQKNRTIT